jgi:hypothetical protein
MCLFESGESYNNQIAVNAVKELDGILTKVSSFSNIRFLFIGGNDILPGVNPTQRISGNTTRYRRIV